MSVGEGEAVQQVSKYVELESGIVGDEPTDKGRSCCGRAWKCLTYEFTPSPNLAIALSAGVATLLVELGIYLACGHCPVTNCTVPLESSWAISPIGFGGALLFAGITKAMCVLADTVAGTRNGSKSEAAPLITDHVELEDEIQGDEPTDGEQNSCGRVSKCLTYELGPSPRAVIAVGGYGTAGLLGVGLYLAIPSCFATNCAVPLQSYGWTSLFGFGGGIVFTVLTKVACVFADVRAGKRPSVC